MNRGGDAAAPHPPPRRVYLDRARFSFPPGLPRAAANFVLDAGEIQAELGISASNLSHHLDKLKRADVVRVKREGSFLRYTADAATLQELLAFLFSECCTRTKAVQPDKIIQISK